MKTYLGKHAAQLGPRDMDVWFANGKTPMTDDTTSPVNIYGEQFQRVIALKVAPGIYNKYPAASGTANTTNLCYARYSPKFGLFFTALDEGLITSFSEVIVSQSNGAIDHETALATVAAHIGEPVQIDSPDLSYLYRALADSLRAKNGDIELINWLNEKADQLSASVASDTTKTCLAAIQEEAKNLETLQNLFNADEHTLPWSLGVRIETAMEPLFDYYESMIEGKSEEQVNLINAELLQVFGEKLKLTKRINGVVQPVSETFFGEVGKTPFDFKEENGVNVLRLAMKKIIEKFSGGYVQFAHDLLGITKEIAIKASEQTRQNNLTAVDEILNHWEFSISPLSFPFDATKTSPHELLIRAFYLSVDKRDVIHTALKTAPAIFNEKTGEFNRDELAKNELEIIRQFKILLLADADLEDTLSETNEQPDNPELTEVVNQLTKRTNSYLNYLNKQLSVSPSKEIVLSLRDALTNPDASAKDKIINFYSILHQDNNKNITEIKKDNGVLARNYIQYIAIIATTVVTGVLPGLLIMGIVYALTGKRPQDLVKSQTVEFTGHVELLKTAEALTTWGLFDKPKPGELVQERQHSNTP